MPLRNGEQTQGEGNQNNQQESGDNQTSGNSTSDNQETNEPQNQVIKDQAYYDLLERTVQQSTQALRTIQEQNRVLQDQVRGINERVNTQSNTTTTPPKTEEEERNEFFQNPKKMFREMIKEEMQATVAPLQQQVSSLLGASAKDSLLGKFERDPKFAKAFADKLVKYHVEQVLEEQKRLGQPINEAVVTQAVIQVMGLRNLDMLPAVPGLELEQHQEQRNVETRDGSGSNNNRQITSENQRPANRGSDNMIPPHLRSSPPAGPRGNNNGNGNNGAPTRVLTEQEKYMARLNRMTDAEYIELMDMPAHKVAHSSPPANNQGGQK